MKKFFNTFLGKNDEEDKEKKSTHNTSVQTKNKEKIKDKATYDIEAQPKTVSKINPVEKKVETTQVQSEFIPPFLLKRLVDKKLTIILIENTAEVAKEKDTILKIITTLVSEGLICVINYGNIVRESKILDISDFNNIILLINDDMGETARLYDALLHLENIVSKEIKKIEEKENERIRINKIEVIGIGTCKDSGSRVTKKVAINSFCKIANNPDVITKYFCLTEQTFMNAAEIGFRSIGSISRNY